jgi:L-ascorbate metabolism protein UlaG (beta-lactamase superfamily)
MSFAGPKRFHPPPVALAALPELDAVLISHDHYDHLDRGTIRSLAKTPVPFVTSLGVGAHLESWGVSAERITELDWWEGASVGALTVTASPAQHFSGRGLKDRNTTLWSSFHLRGPQHSFFFGADTGLTAEYVDIAERLGPFDAVALEIGAYHPSWGAIHMGPDNAMTAYSMLGTGALLPIHWGTFNLAMHAWYQPIETVFDHAISHGVPLLTPRLGQPVEPARRPAPERWWRTVTAKRRAPVREPKIEDGNAPLEFLPD